MSNVDYVTLQAIREDSGMQHQKNGEVPTGAVNGSNTIFYLSKTPLADRDYDDVVTPSDVIVRVDGVPVNITSLQASTGKLVLASPPGNGTQVTVEYAYSPLTDATVEAYRVKAQAWLNRRVKNIFDLTTIKDVEDVPDAFINIVTLFASGLILIKDFGSSADTDGTSKDGYKKLDLARDLLKEYIMDETDDPDSPENTGDKPSVIAHDGPFTKRNSDGTSKDAWWWRHRDDGY